MYGWETQPAASCDSTPHKQGMSKIKTIANRIAIEDGNGSLSKVSGSGELHGRVCDKTGTELGLTRSNKYNLFSISKRLNKGWTMTGDKTGMVLAKGDQGVKFDLIIPTHKGVIYAMYYIKRNLAPQDEVAGIGTTKTVKLNIKRAHEMLGHMSEDMTCKAAKHLG